MESPSAVLADLNKVSSQGAEILELRSISSLNVNKAYIIKRMSVFKTRFGKSCLVHLFDEGENINFKSFIPKRIAECISDDIVEKINSSPDGYTLSYLGQSAPIFEGAKTSSLIKFDRSEKENM